MSTYLLIHGSWHGGWCWYKVLPRLEKAGHRVVAPDLPSLGTDRTPIAQISLDTWTDSSHSAPFFLGLRGFFEECP